MLLHAHTSSVWARRLLCGGGGGGGWGGGVGVGLMGGLCGGEDVASVENKGFVLWINREPTLY
jgi:hypothetical protein